MARDLPEQKAETSKTGNDNDAGKAKWQVIAGEAHKEKAPIFSLSSSDLLKTEKQGLSVESKQGIANFVGTGMAGVLGTVAWSLADKAVGNSRYGLAAKAAAAVITGGLSRVAGKGGTEHFMLESKDKTTGLADFAWGAVDAIAAIGAFKAEEAFSRSWKIGLGRSSGAHLSQEIMLEQGAKILQGQLGKRIVHNGMRGMLGGGTGALLWSTPHEIANNYDKLDTIDGITKTGANIAASTVFGSLFGGALMGGGTMALNAREFAGMTKAAVLGKQGRYTLDVYHFNDGHSSLLGERSTLGQLAGKAETLRTQSSRNGRSSLVLELGDAHSGNAAAQVSNTGELEQAMIQQFVKVDGTVPGNHSADTGFAGNAKDFIGWIKNMRALDSDLRVTGREVPGVAANVQSLLDENFTGTSGIYKPYRIFVDPKTGDKVGMVGLVTDQLQGVAPKLLDDNLLAQLDRLSPEAQKSVRSWFEMAAAHPQAKLQELAPRYASNKVLQEMAKIYPDKRISDLHQVMVSDPLNALNQSVEALKKEGVNKVVVLSHLGKTQDLDLAKEGPRVAAYFGAHSHDLEPTPLFVRNQRTGSDVLVTQAGSHYGWLGEANLVFNKDGSLNRHLSSGKIHVIDETVATHKQAGAFLENHLSSSPDGQQLRNLIGKRFPIQVANELPLDNIRGQKGVQTPLANLLTRAFKEGGDQVLPKVNAERATQNLPALADSVDAVMLQSGGIRSGLPAGQLDELTVGSMFMNKPVMVELTGEQIQKALSYGVHDFPAAQPSNGLAAKIVDTVKAFGRESSPLAHFDASGKNIIADGLRFNVDRSLPTYARVTGLEIFDKSLGRYVPVDPNKRYTVLTVTHLIGRFGNTPLMPSPQARSISLAELGPEYWVLGKQMEPAAANALLKASELPSSSSRDFLLAHLQSNSRGGKFSLKPELTQSPMRDISPGSWVPALRPDWQVLGLAALSANQAGKK